MKAENRAGTPLPLGVLLGRRVWSAQHKFEWMDGFGNGFGLIYVDFDTLERTPKLGAEWFRATSSQNAVV